MCGCVGGDLTRPLTLIKGRVGKLNQEAFSKHNSGYQTVQEAICTHQVCLAVQGRFTPACLDECIRREVLLQCIDLAKLEEHHADVDRHLETTNHTMFNNGTMNRHLKPTNHTMFNKGTMNRHLESTNHTMFNKGTMNRHLESTNHTMFNKGTMNRHLESTNHTVPATPSQDRG